jgi:hypothetical protein
VASFDEVVPPGKAGSIKASVHTANYKGSIGKAITVTHDDPTQGPITVSLLAKIVGSVEILPYPAVQIGRTRRGFETPAKLLVRKDTTETGTLEISGLASSAEWLKVTSRKVEADEPAVDGLPAAVPGDILLAVRAEGAPVGTSVVNVSFKTGMTREPQVTIPVTVNVQPVVTVQPNDLILNPNPNGAESASGEALVAVREDLDPKKVTVVSDVPAFVVRVDPPGERAFRVFVEWSGKGKTAAPTSALIHIRVGKENVDLPVRVNLARVAQAP